jgi:hypothetical protein
MHGQSFEGASHFRVQANMTPKKSSISLRKYRVKMALNSSGKTYDSSSRMPKSHSGTPRRPDKGLGALDGHGGFQGVPL